MQTHTIGPLLSTDHLNTHNNQIQLTIWNKWPHTSFLLLFEYLFESWKVFKYKLQSQPNNVTVIFIHELIYTTVMTHYIFFNILDMNVYLIPVKKKLASLVCDWFHNASCTGGRCKLPTVITSLDSTLYHCHQQCFSPKYRRIVFFNNILFWTYLLKI